MLYFKSSQLVVGAVFLMSSFPVWASQSPASRQTSLPTQVKSVPKEINQPLDQTPSDLSNATSSSSTPVSASKMPLPAPTKASMKSEAGAYDPVPSDKSILS